MNTVGQLLGLYEKWRLLTLKEGSAIAGDDWCSVERFQEAKSLLKMAIIACSNRAQATCRNEEDSPSVQRFIQELIDLEGTNAALLASKRAEAELRRQELQRNKKTLGQVRNSYAPVIPKTWSSYS